MNKLFILFLFLFFSCNNKAQDLNNIKLLTKAYTNKNDEVFLEKFPKNFDEFKSTFGWNDKLNKPNILYNDANNYIDRLFALVSKSKYNNFKTIIIEISIGGKWEADAVGYFQNQLHEIIKTDKEFIFLLNDLNEKKINLFWTFYFDKENLSYPKELDLVLGSEMKNTSKIIFEKIKKSRNKQPEIIAKNKQSIFEIYDNDGYTNLREDKNSTSKIIDKLNSGEEVTIIESIEDWWKIKSKIGKIGYVHKSRLRIKTENNLSNNEFGDLKNKGFKIILEKKCDLNQDGVDDKIIVFANSFPKKIETSDYIKHIILVNIKNKMLKNDKVILDYYSDNIAVGFSDIKIKDNFFTIEQANGSGNGISRDYTTFKYVTGLDKIILHKYSTIVTDRSSGDENEKTYNYTSKNFGVISFEQYNSETITEKCKK
ncbi:SH3 domain-containing protein [Flavobacterium psychrophilum]|nr:SH3 domain-containing protein [Flavobacterium psychrophilum]